MTPNEIGPFLKRIAVTDPRILPGDEDEAFAALALWAVALADVEADFALNAVARHYGNSPYTVKPSDITAQWRAHVKDSVNRHVDPAPDTDDPAEYRAQLAAGRAAAGHGQPTPGRQAIGPGKYDVAAAAAEITDDDVRALRAQGDFKSLWTESLREQKAANDARKRLVLQHDDLAERIRDAQGLTAAENWNGRIPPEFTSIGGGRNRSRVRVLVLEVVAEAERRAATQQTAA
ncbi:hypothetical protein [Kitasatospora cineracea]|uniref:Uncharacterized protein n=1 Tax=Kitasatospora cineracea TaxID=88074 RepID=A0A3N4RNH7_9ACTN|nr:hypothetical protein [Kitasatospora cineracea]RPE34962.1 hypothetical protein EDD38_3305 [Kitasatospora cineracea]